MTAVDLVGSGTLTGEWFPIGRSDDAPFRHVHQAKLLGQELAVWRADDGYVNVWENRCLHRGVRLSVGMNEGRELRCMYHGWRYASRSAGCTYIPAHPADAPARTICNRTFEAREIAGLIWTRLVPRSTGDEADGPSQPFEFDAGSEPAGRLLTLRSLPVNAGVDPMARALAEYPLATGEVVPVGADGVHRFRLRVPTADGDGVFLIQPVDRAECVVHAVLLGGSGATDGLAGNDELALWRRHAAALSLVRDRVEATVATEPRPEPLVPALELVEPSDDEALAVPRGRHEAELRVVVHRKWMAGRDIAGLEFRPLEGTLPVTQPGAHIDVHLPNGLIRQYSLTNPSGVQESYIIGVKREPNSAGGSACLHETVRMGDVLAISAPRNNFPLRRDATSTLLLAGGVGITPLLAMAETLEAAGLRYHLHCFARSADHVAFADRIAALGGHATTHLGLDGDESLAAVAGIVDRSDADAADTHPQVYVCGPGPFLDGARAACAEAGWSDEAVHFEYFANLTWIDASSTFTVHLARSGLSFEVGEGQTILDGVRDVGVPLASSCERGACGTCVVAVIDGQPHHQDVYLKPSEREAGNRIATCVSRSLSPELALDL